MHEFGLMRLPSQKNVGLPGIAWEEDSLGPGDQLSMAHLTQTSDEP